MLGRGIYFAQRSEYSHSYRHKMGNGISSMFLCNVIVGDSQDMPMTRLNANVKDTNRKNNVDLRYESIKGKH